MTSEMAALAAAHKQADAFLAGLKEMPVAPVASAAQLRSGLDLPLAKEGVDPAVVIDDLAAAVKNGLMGSASGRFFGWVIGGSLPAALGADWLTTVWEQNAALYAVSPAAAVAEEVAGKWLKQVLGLPAEASFGFVTGCQMAHVTCLAAARHALLERQGWAVENRGLYGAPAIRVLTSRERHATVDRAWRLLGCGSDSIEGLEVDGEGRLRAAALERALAARGEAPTLVVLQAGDIHTGAFDDFGELIPLAHRYRAWVHVDGAFGLWAAAAPKRRHLMAGAEAADSWATDGHKWLNVPYDSGYAFVRDAGAHRASHSTLAPYIEHDTVARDPIHWNPEWSRRARGFATYAALRQLGREGLATQIERACAAAERLTREIGALPGAEVVHVGELNQGMVRFLAPGGAAADHDRRTEAVIAAVCASGEAFFGASTWQGRRVMRISVCNWRTDDGEVDRVVAAVRNVLTQG